jgi:hypothetical protein
MNRFAWAVLGLSFAAPLAADDVKVFTPSRTGDAPVYMNGEVVRIDRAAGTITLRASDGTRTVMNMDRASLASSGDLRPGARVILGYQVTGSGTSERRTVSDIRPQSGFAARTNRPSVNASATSSGAQNMGTAEVVSVDAAGRRLTVIDSTGARRVLDVRGAAVSDLAGLSAGDRVSLGLAAPLVRGTPAGTITSIDNPPGSATAGFGATNAAGASARSRETAPGRTPTSATTSRLSNTRGTEAARATGTSNQTGTANTTGANTTGANTTGANTTGANTAGTSNTTGTNATGTNNMNTGAVTNGTSSTAPSQPGTLSFQPRPGDTNPPPQQPNENTTPNPNAGSTANTGTPSFDNRSLPNPPALPNAPASGVSRNPAQAGTQPVPQAQPVPGVQAPSGIQPVPGAQPLPGTGATGQNAANPGLAPQPVPGAGGQNANNSGATGGTSTAQSAGVAGGTAGNTAIGNGTGAPLAGGVGGTTGVIPQVGGVSTSSINSQIPSIPQNPGGGTTAVLPLPSVMPGSNPPRTPAEVAQVRELASRDFDAAVASLGATAAQADRAWIAYRASCVTTTTPLNNRSREWFGVLDGSIVKPTDDTCEQSYSEVERLAFSVRNGLDTARDAARQGDVLPGRMREVLQRYNLDL